MPLDPSIPLQSADPVQTMAQMVGIRSSLQSMAAQRQAMQMRDQEMQNNAISLQERQNLQSVLSNHDAYTNPETGDIDFQKLQPMVLSVAPTTGAEVIAKMAGLQQEKTRAVGMIQAQNQETNNRAASGIMSLIPQDGQTSPSKEDFDTMFEKVIKPAYANDKRLSSVIQTIQDRGDHVFGMKDQSGQPDHQAINKRLRQLSTMFMPQEAQQGLATSQYNLAASKNPVVTDNANNLAVLPRDEQGRPIGVRVIPSENEIPVGETPESRAQLIKERGEATEMAKNVNSQHLYNQNAIRMLSDPDFQNPNTAWGVLQKKYSGLTGGDYKTTLDSIAQNLAAHTQVAEKTMGVHTDAGRAANSAANGDLSSSPGALLAALKMSDATLSGVSAYNSAKEAAIQSGGIFKKRDLDNAWAQVYDPKVFMLHNAIGSGDTAEINKIKSDAARVDANYRGKGIAPGGMKDLIQKSRAIESLIKTGQLPQGQ